MPTMLGTREIATALGRDGEYEPVPGRWPVERVRAWYDGLPWLTGTNYYPATAVNQLEMWQAETWDPETIDRELGWAEDLGFTTQRVYLHDLAWAHDERGLYERMDRFLDICAAHDMRPFFVFFDDCHHPRAEPGPQPPPVPGYHNSGWVTSPTRDVAVRFRDGRATEAEVDRLRGYVQRTIERFGGDRRVLMWELHNEPGRGSAGEAGHDGDLLRTDFGDGSRMLVQASWEWAREVGPDQPICSNTDGCVGDVNWSINTLNSDLLSIHDYGPADHVLEHLAGYADDGRPVVMTEYVARTLGSTFQDVMPVLKEHGVGAVNWGFVSGKTGTIWGWESRLRDGAFVGADELREAGEVLRPGDPFPEPELWFHDILRADGTPFDEDEVATIKRLNGRT